MKNLVRFPLYVAAACVCLVTLCVVSWAVRPMPPDWATAADAPLWSPAAKRATPVMYFSDDWLTGEEVCIFSFPDGEELVRIKASGVTLAKGYEPDPTTRALWEAMRAGLRPRPVDRPGPRVPGDPGPGYLADFDSLAGKVVGGHKTGDVGCVYILPPGPKSPMIAGWADIEASTGKDGR